MENAFLRVILTTCEDVGTPRALTVKLLVHAGEWAQLAQLRVNPKDYVHGEDYWRDCVVTDLLRKCDLPSGIDREGEARRTFLLCEQENAKTNARLSRFVPENLLIEDNVDEAVYRFIGEWRKDIRSVVGSLPSELTARFSRGATYADVGKLITAPDKMSSRPTIYSRSRTSILPFWGMTSWGRSVIERSESDPKAVRGNIFFTVPKDGKTFRGCCKEASLNVAYQLDVGRLLKTRLLRIGIDLREGQSIHREAARQASLDGSMATIDMSNASDTLCRVLPRLTLPGDWWELLDSLRAPLTRMNGKWFVLEKFSSMGNGFTFELESLLFATLARTIVRLEGGDPSVVLCYGDDLIVPTAHYVAVVAGLRLFGFTPNMKKTFAEGPFRESCGGDYWDGVPVRAHYLESLPDEPQHWISLANGLRRIAKAKGVPASRWDILRRSWMQVLDQLPTQIRRLRGPTHLGDVVIHDDPDKWGYTDPPDSHDPSWELRYVYAYVPVPVVLPWHHWRPSVQLASCTLGYPSDGITPRGGVAGYRIRKLGATLTNAWLPEAVIS